MHSRLTQFQNKRKFRRVLYSKTSIIVLVIIILLMMRAVWDVYSKEKTSEADANAIQTQLASLQNQTQSLNQDINKLQTSEGVESTIRQNFHMGKQGEQLVIVTDLASTTPSAPQDLGFWGTIGAGFAGLWHDAVSLFK